MDNIEKVDETYDLNSINAYCLSIRISPDGFSFCIADKQQEKIVAFKQLQYANRPIGSEELAEAVYQLIIKEEHLPKEPAKVNVIYVTPNFTLVPTSLLLPEKAKEILSLTHAVDDLDEIHFSQTNIEDSTLVFSIPSAIVSKIKSIYPAARLMPQVTPFLSRLQQDHRDHACFVGVHINESFFDLSIFSNGKLLLLNAYTYESPSDVLYHIANALNAFQHSEVMISLAGATEERLAIIPALKKFYSNTINDPYIGDFTLSYKIEDRIQAQFANLFYSATCE
ncbi:DUF3822 family protein [Williamwhitmania taraxaci]|uniref:DUF3822 domain-containing protein n=1 Tax=Williamwhitmania taraxaci TaxID=1640674 RepID=A0A1G6H6D9_9BACT|nr:DUF3822 family protein [Williamwhitmania taraxaci]SDB89723.1 Protein of unknown function [Williamwhitmania taraxaci]